MAKRACVFAVGYVAALRQANAVPGSDSNSNSNSNSNSRDEGHTAELHHPPGRQRRISSRQAPTIKAAEPRLQAVGTSPNSR